MQPSETRDFVAQCQTVIRRVAGQLIQEKKRKITEAEEKNQVYQGKDLLSLMRECPRTIYVHLTECRLVKSNESVDLPKEQRISDEDLLNTINTFMFAGTDTTSLAMTWTLWLLVCFPDVQTRLRAELHSIAPSVPIETLTADEVQSLYTAISELPYLNNVIRETLRLIPPVHSSIRVATQDDVVPISSPLKRTLPGGDVVEEDVKSIVVPKGTFIHVPVEGFNLDKELWGDMAWHFE